MKYYAVTHPIFAINRSFLSRPLPMYLGAKFSELASAKDVEVTVFSSQYAAEKFAKTIKNDDRAVGILSLGVLDSTLLSAEEDKEGVKITLAPNRFLLIDGECPRLDGGCRYGIAVPEEKHEGQLLSEKSLSQKITDYFKYYVEKCGVIYKMVGLDHEQEARNIVETMKNPNLSDKEITDYLQKILQQLVSESVTNVNKAFYKTLAYAIFKINDANIAESKKNLSATTFSNR